MVDLSGTDSALPSSGSLPGPVPAERRIDRLPIARKMGYGAGQLVELSVSSMLNIFVLFYVTAVCGLPGWMAGIALGAGLVIDAVMEPVIGSLSDGWRSRFGRRVPFMAVALLPILITYNLIFALPAALGDAALFAWLMLLSVTLRIALSFFTLPYQALGAELSDDYAERSSIAVWRWGIGILATMAVIVLGYGVFLAGPGGMSQRSGYLPLTLTLSLFIIVGGAIAIRTGLATRDRQHVVAAPAKGLSTRLFGEVKEVFRNRTFVILFVASLLFNIGGGLNQALQLHTGTFILKLDSGQMQLMSLAAVLGLAAGAPLTAPFVKRMEKRTMLIVGKLGMFLLGAAPVTLKLMGLLTITGTPLSGFLAFMSFFYGASMAVSIIAFVSIVADAADEHEYIFGTRREGLYFAGWSFATKSATGAGLLIAGLVLQLIQFPSGLSERGAAADALPPETITWLGIAAAPGAGSLSLLAILVILLYRLDRREYTRISSELKSRRAAARS